MECLMLSLKNGFIRCTLCLIHLFAMLSLLPIAGFTQSAPPLKEILGETTVNPSGPGGWEWDVTGYESKPYFLGDDGSFIIVYKRGSNDGFYFTIFDRYGNKNDFEVFEEGMFGTSVWTDISVSALEDGDFVLAFSTRQSEYCDDQIMARRYHNDGSSDPLWQFQRIDEGVKPPYYTANLEFEVVGWPSEEQTPNKGIITFIDVRKVNCEIWDDDSVDGKIFSFDKDGWEAPENVYFLCGDPADCDSDP